jgi:multidrug efflux pump subunit AcrB
MSIDKKLGMSGRLAERFQSAQITPLLALVALLLGVFAVLVTPREEEPQINVTMANVITSFPGASVKDVEQMVSIPSEQVLSKMAGVDHVFSVSKAGVSILTVQFKVGIPRTEALVRLHDTIKENADLMPKNLGVMEALIKPKGIDDVPIMALTLHGQTPEMSAYDLERVAHGLEIEIKRVRGTRDVVTLGGPGRSALIQLDPQRMAGFGVTVAQMRSALQSANQGTPVGELLGGNQSVAIETGPYLSKISELEEVVVHVKDSKLVYLRDVADVKLGPPPANRYVWHGESEKDGGQQYPAVTLSVTKKTGENAIDVANQIMARVEQLKGTVIPDDVVLVETRNYGASANEKAQKLIHKLMFATALVVVLVIFALGQREALIVGCAVVLTLTVTLFASWAWGFTLNRVSLFALIFSIGILVDDAIVVVENIHRHQLLYPEKPLKSIIPHAVDEVGGPTILATFTVIAALLPMAFVSGLMGPYMSPIPINASMGMVLSLVIAFVVTPWLALIWMKQLNTSVVNSSASHDRISERLQPFFERVFAPLLDVHKGAANRLRLGLAVVALLVFSVLLPANGWVVLKMLPFDNKSEFQVVVDMPAGTSLEKTAAALQEMGHYLAGVPEVTHYQVYAGMSAPINFNGLVRQYYHRLGAEYGDIQVNLVDKAHRADQSHGIATRLRPDLQKIGLPYGANVKMVEVPPGPPVMSPIVAEIYGPDEQGRREVAKELRAVFEQTPGVVDIDDSSLVQAPRKMLLVDQRKAAQLGVSQQEIASTLHAGLAGEAVTYLHDGSKYPNSAWIQLPPQRHGDLTSLLQLGVKNSTGKVVPISELVTLSESFRDQPIIHKDLLPVNFVTADTAGVIDSPLYGIFKMRSELAKIKTPNGQGLDEFFIQPPLDAWRTYAIKWDGELQITYETFRDMAEAYAVGLILIYLLVVVQFGSYLLPLIIMAPIPLTIIGVMPGHALLGAQYTATSMIGMIALAGIIVRNSILLVDFINLQLTQGVEFKRAIVQSAVTRAKPIALTGLAAMLGALFILDDPIFNGLAISLIFGILVSTLLTLVVIPVLYFMAYRHEHEV